MSRVLFLLAFFAATACGGCATVTDAGYYWRHHSYTLFRYTKKPSEERLLNHIDELTDIIDASKARGLRVPPGVYAELGFLQGQRGDDELARSSYEQETSLYPESRVFIERLLASQQAERELAASERSQ